MTRLHLAPLVFLLIIHSTTSLKLLTLFNPYVIQAQSTTQLEKQQSSEELPIYRDLPPIKNEPKDLSEALEATRNLKFTRPPLDADAFYASLRKAAEEVQNVVIGVAPPFADIQIKKSDTINSADNSAEIKENVNAKSSNEAFENSTKSPPTNLQVKRSENSFVVYTGGEAAALQKAASDVAVNVQAPFTNVQVRKQVAVQEEPTEVPLTDSSQPPTGAGVGVHVEAPFTNVQVQKGAGYGYAGAGVHVEAPFTSVKVGKHVPVVYEAPGAIPPKGSPEFPPGAGVGVHVEAPFTNVQVNKGVGYGYGGPVAGTGVNVEAPFTNVKVQKGIGIGTQVGINVDVPFTNVKVKKVAGDIPPGNPAVGPANGGGGYHEAGVHVDVPFVKVKVGGAAVAKDGPPVVDPNDQGPPRPLVGIGGFLTPLPKRPGKPLDLDINIPGIFNLRLFRDQAGRGRLGIGVLPIFSSLVAQEHPVNSYPKSTPT